MGGFWGYFWHAWTVQPSVAIGLLGALGGYCYAMRRAGLASALDRWRAVAFVGGILTLALALLSPLDALADQVLLTAHMFQHLLLILVVPPLLLYGMPEWLVARMLASPALQWTVPILARPLVSLLLFLGVLWIWHVPTLYEAALHDESVHAFQHLTFLALATGFWWPLVRPGSPIGRLPAVLQLADIFAVAVGSTMLAALITFSPAILYPTYAATGARTAVAGLFGMAPSIDQQIAGLSMWIVGGLWLFGAAIVVFARWFSASSPEVDE